MLICGYHVEENKEREQEFISSLDPKQLPTGFDTAGISFFLMCYNQSVKPQLMVDPAGGEVMADIEDNSLFLAANNHGEGREAVGVLIFGVWRCCYF